MKKIISVIMCTVLAFFAAVPVWGTSESVDEVTEGALPESSIDAAAPAGTDPGFTVSAKAAVLMEKTTGRVLYSQNENEKLYPASVTKIMTMLLVCEALEEGKISLEEEIVCTDNAASKGGSQIWLEPGEVMTAEELLKATCVYSANDACTLLGERISGSEEAFISLMNERAAELGMKNTHFDNCTGLDDATDTHLTTAYDVGLMSCELLKHDMIKTYTTIWMDSLRDGETQLVNTNRLVRFYNGITGLKTGTTEKAGCCVSASAQREGMELVAVVMGSENSADRFTGAQKLLDWGFASYEIFCPVVGGGIPSEVAVEGGREDAVAIVVPQLQPLLINRGRGADVSVKADIAESLTAPVDAGQSLGSLKVYLGEELAAEYKITAKDAVEKLTFFTAMLKMLTSFSG